MSVVQTPPQKSFTELYRVLFFKVFWSLPSFTEIYRVLPSFPYRPSEKWGKYRRPPPKKGLPSCTEFFFSKSFALYRVVPSFTEFFFVGLTECEETHQTRNVYRVVPSFLFVVVPLVVVGVGHCLDVLLLFCFVYFYRIGRQYWTGRELIASGVYRVFFYVFFLFYRVFYGMLLLLLLLLLLLWPFFSTIEKENGNQSDLLRPCCQRNVWWDRIEWKKLLKNQNNNNNFKKKIK